MKIGRVVSDILPLVMVVVLLGVLALGIPDADAGARMRVRNGSGSSIGSIDADGTVRNGTDSSCGKLEGCASSDRHAAAAGLFFFEPPQEK